MREAVVKNLLTFLSNVLIKTLNQLVFKFDLTHCPELIGVIPKVNVYAVIVRLKSV